MSKFKNSLATGLLLAALPLQGLLPLWAEGPQYSPFNESLLVNLAKNKPTEKKSVVSAPVQATKLTPKPTVVQVPANTFSKQPEAFALQQLQEDPNAGKAPVTVQSEAKSAPLQGSITTLKVTKGRSQIIKFAQPITRISIAEPTLAELVPLAPDQIMINGKQRGVTSLIVWDKDGQEGVFDLYVQNDTSELLDAVRAIAPNEKIDVRITDDSFIISGQVSSSIVLDEIRKTASAYGFRDQNFIDLTETPVPQVVLDVKIAEANRSTLRSLQTSFDYRTGDLKVTRLGSAIQGTTTSTLDPLRRGVTLPQQSSTNLGGVIGALLPSPKLKFDIGWDMLETQGKIAILAQPSLVCTHGRTANFLAGGEFPFTSGTDQNGSPIISFREYGVKLKFTPWIALQSGRIELKVEPEVSSLDSSNCISSGAGQVCGLLKRNSSTTVELKDGESLMIAGILTREEQNTLRKLPFIGDLPVLGLFFKNANLQKTDRELVVVVTPRIVKQGDYGKILGGPG